MKLTDLSRRCRPVLWSALLLPGLLPPVAFAEDSGFQAAAPLALMADPGAISAQAVTGETPDQQGQIARSIQQILSQEAPEANSEKLASLQALENFYQARNYQPLWIGDQGFIHAAQGLLAEILASEKEGLDPYDYHVKSLQNPVHEQRLPESIEKRAELDLLLSDAFFLLATHYENGKISPLTWEIEPVSKKSPRDLLQFLDYAVTHLNIRQNLQALLPDRPAYLALKQSLEQLRDYRLRVGEWTVLPLNDFYTPDEALPQSLALLRQRLFESGDLETLPDDPAAPFDETLEAGVKRFQYRHGLASDGIVGQQTLAALNISISGRIEQLLVNMERWRWLPDDLGSRRVEVNIAGFELTLFDQDQPVLKLPVIVGRDERRTPVFSDAIRYIVFNPTWTVPTNLLIEDKLPIIRKDPGYLSRLGFTVYRGWDRNREAVDPASIDWFQLGRDNLNISLVQGPGPQNALGQVKFVFPNKYDIYLHDTPSRELFRESSRAFSSGCIRVKEPLKLANTLLALEDRWNEASTDWVIKQKKTRTLTLKTPVPVHLLYWTATVDEEGVVRFPPDIYARDIAIGDALLRG